MNNTYKKVLALGLQAGDNVQIIMNKKKELIAVRFLLNRDEFISISWYPELEDKVKVMGGKQSRNYMSPTPRVSIIDEYFPKVRKPNQKYIFVDFSEVNTALTKLPGYTTPYVVDPSRNPVYPGYIGEVIW